MKHVVFTLVLLAACNRDSPESPVLQKLGAEELKDIHIRNIRWSCWRDRSAEKLFGGIHATGRVEFDIRNETEHDLDSVALLVTAKVGSLSLLKVPVAKYYIFPIRSGEQVHFVNTEAFDDLTPTVAEFLLNPKTVSVDVDLVGATRYQRAKD